MSSQHDEYDPDQRGDGLGTSTEQRARRTVAPGKATLTSRLGASPASIARAVVAQLQAAAAPASAVPARGDLAGPDLLSVAAAGTAGSGGPLPFLDEIQRAFGHHDVSGVSAHVGGAAAEASEQIGAVAYAAGDDVAFAGAPDLRLAAHEAAHVVQQRGGVRLSDGVGRAGDEYERHADAVADAVVRGDSAESLLDGMAHRGAAGGPAVQREETANAPASPAGAAGAASAEDAASIDRALDLARDFYFNATGSVMDQRARAITELGNAITNDDSERDDSVLAAAASTALGLATAQIGSLVGTLLTRELASVAGDAARALDEFVKDFVGDSLEDRIAAAGGSLGRDGARAASRFINMQGNAVSDTSLAGLAAFDQRREAFHRGPNAVAQAQALARAYQTAASGAYEAQWRTTLAEWNRLLTRSEGFAASVLRNATDGDVPGVLTIDLDVEGDRLSPARATIPELTSEARAMFADRSGTLGDLRVAGQEIAVRLGGDAGAPVIHARPGEVTGSHMGLVLFANERYGTQLDVAAPNASEIAAGVIWARALMNLAIRDLPAVQ